MLIENGQYDTYSIRKWLKQISMELLTIRAGDMLLRRKQKRLGILQKNLELIYCDKGELDFCQRESKIAGSLIPRMPMHRCFAGSEERTAGSGDSTLKASWTRWPTYGSSKANVESRVRINLQSSHASLQSKPVFPSVQIPFCGPEVIANLWKGD